MDSLPHPPVFLVGAERSGTTLLRLMLDQHPRITWCNEFEYVVDFWNADGSFPDLTLFQNQLSYHRIFQATGFTIDNQLGYPEICTSFLLQKLEQRPSAIIVGATCHRHYDRLLTLWPSARFIFLYRDGRDVARSCMGMGWAGNVYHGSSRWIDSMNLWESIKKKLDPTRFVELRYESLIEQPETKLTTLCQFLHQEFDPAVLSYDQDSTYGKPDPKLCYQWKTKLRTAEVQLVESRAATTLQSWGYSLSGLPLLEISGWHKFRLGLQNRLAKQRFRYRRFGFGLSVLDSLTRRLGFRSWNRACRIRMNKIRTENLK